MTSRQRHAVKPVSIRGALAQSVLCGAGANNQGLRVRILQDQRRGHQGPLEGTFVILHAGDNKHSDSLFPLLNKLTDAAEVARVIRERYANCVSVTNTNILIVESEHLSPPKAAD